MPNKIFPQITFIIGSCWCCCGRESEWSQQCADIFGLLGIWLMLHHLNYLPAELHHLVLPMIPVDVYFTISKIGQMSLARVKNGSRIPYSRPSAPSIEQHGNNASCWTRIIIINTLLSIQLLYKLGLLWQEVSQHLSRGPLTLGHNLNKYSGKMNQLIHVF